MPQYAVPGPPGGPKPGDDKKKTTIVAIVAALAVVVAAGVTGFLVLGKDDDDSKNVAGKEKTASPSAKPSETATGSRAARGEPAGLRERPQAAHSGLEGRHQSQVGNAVRRSR